MSDLCLAGAGWEGVPITQNKRREGGVGVCLEWLAKQRFAGAFFYVTKRFSDRFVGMFPKSRGSVF